MNVRPGLLWSVCLLLALLLGGCSAAKVTNTWKQEGYADRATNVLVIGVSANQANRRIFEAGITERLKAHGIKATPSYLVLAEDEINREAVVAYAEKEGIDSVMVTKVLDSKAFEQRVTHATTSSSGSQGVGRNPHYRGFNGWYDDYRYWQTNVVTYDSNYFVSNLEASLYRSGGKGMVWTALVELESVDNDSTAINDLAEALVKQMAKDGLL